MPLVEESRFESKTQSGGVAAWEAGEVAYGDEEGGGLFGFVGVATLEIIDGGKLFVGQLNGVKVNAMCGESAG